jgi:hypothetical protein
MSTNDSLNRGHETRTRIEPASSDHRLVFVRLNYLTFSSLNKVTVYPHICSNIGRTRMLALQGIFILFFISLPLLMNYQYHSITRHRLISSIRIFWKYLIHFIKLILPGLIYNFSTFSYNISNHIFKIHIQSTISRLITSSKDSPLSPQIVWTSFTIKTTLQ